MKKIILTLALTLLSVSGAFSMTYKEAFEDILTMPQLNGVAGAKDSGSGWIDALRIDNATITYRAHEVGNEQTVFYGSCVDSIARKLPASELIIAGENVRNLFYMFARPVNPTTYEVLILVDQAYYGQTVAIWGHINAHMIPALKKGEVKFGPGHTFSVNIPVMTFGATL